MAWFTRHHDPKAYLRTFVQWMISGLLMGVLGGLLGTAFHYILHGVTDLRGANPWLIWFLPVGGVLIMWIYRFFGLKGNRGTNEIIDAILTNHGVSRRITPAIFLATAVTHLFGGSAGREGAALQLGGSMASLLARIFKLSKPERTVLMLSGMSAVFAGLFGTPMTACLFTMEFESVGTMYTPALLPCFLSAFVASQVSAALGVHAETHMLGAIPALDAAGVAGLLVFAVVLSLLGVLMCYAFHYAESYAHKLVHNRYLRIALGGVVILLMTLLVGDHRYNGAGMDMVLAAVTGQADWYDFALKLLFTAVTLAAGFKGGEIVPTFCIGATFGCVAGGLLGLDPGFTAALGLVGLFCCATNSPLASIILSIEMFGSANLPWFALVCVITFVLSGNSGLYGSQIIQFSKNSLPQDPLRKESKN